jgi:POT family proton-dependent oligopeptide transporter
MFGHPKGLYILFFTELWERFSFYGMKTLLVLYMVNHFLWSQEDASHLLGTYSALAYGLPVVGGFLADRYLGARRAVIIGAVLLTIGHFLMAFEPLPFFYSALGFIIAGVAFLKPNVSTQVGALYRPGDPRRDGAFTIFYMGINLGALIGPLICDYLRKAHGYHYGFAAAGVGMVLGLIVYVLGQRALVEYDQDVDLEDEATPNAQAKPHALPRHVVTQRVIVLLVVFAFVILFWTAFEQSPNAMLQWADKNTNLRMLSTEPPPITLDAADPANAEPDQGWTKAITDWFKDPTITSGQTQSFNPFFIIALAPIFAWFWIWLDKRKLQPSTPAKMTIGIALVGFAFAVMLPAAQSENQPSSAALQALPSTLQIEDNGQVYSIQTDGDGNEEKRVYYGSTRLRYVERSGALQMSGVLTDLDRLRLLAETAPADLIEEFKQLAERTAKQPSQKEYVAQLQLIETVKGLLEDQEALTKLAQSDPESCYRQIVVLVEQAGDRAKDKADKGWQISTALETMPANIEAFTITEGEGDAKKDVLTWDPATRLLTARAEIKERCRVEFLAKAAEPAFKTAVDAIYLDSAKFRVSVWWLIAFFMVLTMGELCLSPVGLSLVTKLAPPARVGLFMGGWFLATAVAEYTAQVFGAYWGKTDPGKYFLIFVVMCGAGALIIALLIRPLKRMMHGVQ